MLHFTMLHFKLPFDADGEAYATSSDLYMFFVVGIVALVTFMLLRPRAL